MDEPTLATCRLCTAPLHQHELERRLCGVCEEYAQQLGVRDKDLDKVVAELMNDPLFQQTTRTAH